MARPSRIETGPEKAETALFGKLSVAQARIEQSFLDGGSVLIAVMDSVNGLTEKLDGLVNLLDPQATRDVSEGMRTVVADLAGLPEAAGRKQGAFQNISSLCDKVYTRVEDMREIIRYLRTIAVTVKITGASIPEFSGFADEIRERIQTVDQEINSFGDQLVAMRNRLRNANTSSESVIRDFAQSIPLLVANMDRSAIALGEQQKRMAATAHHLKQITGTIQGKIATVLSALQIGDVTRQRIEHIMSMIRAHEDFVGSEEARALDASTLDEIEKAIAGLARAQLEESVDELHQRCAGISTTIASFTADAAQVLALRDDLAGQDNASEGSILDRMKGDLSQATALSAKVTDRTQELDQVVSSVGESTQALIAGIGSIRKVKLDIFYMALNSNLACTRLGDAGRSVNVASGELRIFADKLEGPAEAIVQEVQAIEAAKDVLTDGGDVQRAGGIDEPLERARTAVDNAADAMASGLVALSQEGETVFECIEKAIRKLDFRSDLGDVLDDCIRIAADDDVGIDAPVSTEQATIDALSARIFKTYTMVQERDIHRRFFAISENAIVPEPAAASADDDDLFDALF